MEVPFSCYLKLGQCVTKFKAHEKYFEKKPELKSSLALENLRFYFQHTLLRIKAYQLENYLKIDNR